MKPKLNRKRRAGHGFNGVESHGYWVRYERAKNGSWSAYFYGLPAASVGNTLRQLKVSMRELVPFMQESVHNGWEMPKPDGMLPIEQVLASI